MAPPLVDVDQARLLDEERARATFPVREMSAALYGSPENVARRRWILSAAEDLGPERYEWSREEALKRGVDNFIKIHTAFPGYRPRPLEVGWMSESAGLTSSLMPCFALFLPTLLGQCADEQIALWLPKALTFQMVGAYSQSELAHASNLRGIQTTATYDPAAQEFVLHSPTVGSTKWWNSGTGCVATHAAVFARLITRGKDHGVHCFMVQLRDEKHQLLPGVEAGDTGSKCGDNAMDTGYIRFDHVRVPREHLFAKRQHVEPDGTYVRHVPANAEGAAVAGRMTMVRARASMAAICSGRLAVGCTVAARYSCVRLQGFTDETESQEFPVIDYPVQRYRVLRQFAHVFAFRFTSFLLSDKMEQVGADVNAGGAIRGVAEMHALSSGTKSYATRLCADGLEDLRRCCGGHG